MNEFLSLDFELKEFGVLNEEERLQQYRKYVYEASVINRPDKGNAKVIECGNAECGTWGKNVAYFSKFIIILRSPKKLSIIYIF